MMATSQGRDMNCIVQTEQEAVQFMCLILYHAGLLKQYCQGSKPCVVELSGVTRALIGGLGGCIFIYSCSARRISFEIKFISKEIRRAEHEYMNTHPPPPPINALVTPLVELSGVGLEAKFHCWYNDSTDNRSTLLSNIECFFIESKFVIFFFPLSHNILKYVRFLKYAELHVKI